jgi:hypothetical protein
MAEITVTNYRNDKRFGWGYSFTPTGRDPYSIEFPTSPDHTGTLDQIDDARDKDRTWQAHSQGAFYNTAYFYKGRRITHTWRFGLLNRPDNWQDMDDREMYDKAQYGYGWFSGFEPDTDETDVKIRVVG